jgi:hypothetical protein
MGADQVPVSAKIAEVLSGGPALGKQKQLEFEEQKAH